MKLENLDCRLFGPLSVTVNGRQMDIGAPKQRLVLAALLCLPHVSVDELSDTLWSDNPPATARKNIQVYICKLRKIFGSRLTHSMGGYSLRLQIDECDLLQFEETIKRGREALQNGESHVGIDLLGRGLELWGDGPLSEFGYKANLAQEIESLTERFLTVLEEWSELELDRGGHHRVLLNLERFARRYPLRERLAALWMRGLADGGRVSEALSHYVFVRRALSEELGIDPSRTLADIHERLLRGEDIRAGKSALPQRPITVPAQTVTVNQVPRDLSDFVGREPEVRSSLASLSDQHEHDVVLITGAIGVGKTTLAVHLAHLLSSAFPAGQILIDMCGPGGEPKSSGTVLHELMSIIGLDTAKAYSVPQSLAMWRSWVAQHRVLLVLDNATSEEIVKTLIPGSGASRVIVTSRVRLSGVESVFRVDLAGLSRIEGIRLLAQVTGPERVRADAQAAEEIVEFCDRLPLALRIAGAKLSILRHLTLAEYRDRLKAASSALDEIAAGELDFRSRYESFFRGLAQAQQVAYQRIVQICTRPFRHHEMITSLSGLNSDPTSLLESLFECHLLSFPDEEVNAHDMVYEMPKFAYLFASEKRFAV